MIIVAYAVAPGPGGPEAIVNSRLLRALAQYWPSGVSVISAGGAAVADGGGCLSRRAGWTFHIGSGSIRGLQNRQSVLYRCVNRAVYELTGEGLKGQCWMRFAARALRTELARHPSAIVYSRALPYTSIEAVRRVRRRRSFPWIVNINDPLPPDIWPGLYPFQARSCGTIRRSLNKVIPVVNGFTFPCAQLRAMQVEAIGGLDRLPTAILPHLPGSSSPERRVTANVSGGLRIAYGGTMGGNRCRPELIAPLTDFAHREPKLAAQLKFSFYLNNPNRFALDFIKRLPFRTSVSIGLQAEECDEALSSADVLLDIAADLDSPLLQTKMVTYLGLNRPVWAVCKPGGTSWNLVQRGWGYASDVSSGESVCRTLRQIYADWSTGALMRRCPTKLLLDRFTPARHVADLMALSRYISGPDAGSTPAGLPECLGTDWP